MDKQVIRKKMIKDRLLCLPKDLYQFNHQIYQKLIRHPYFVDAKTIGIYVSYKNEVDTHRLIKEYCNQKNIALPKVTGRQMNFYRITSFDELSKGAYGILEPKDHTFIQKDDIDLMIVPLVAYDDENHRIGYGGGFYDRYLNDYKGKTIGLAYKFQKVATINSEIHDISLDEIITNE